MNILVTGYKGFIGKNMVNSLNHNLILYDYGDQLPDFKNLNLVIHLGANSSTTETDVDKIFTQNYDFSCMILDLCKTHKVNLQYASSASVYGKLKEFKEDGAVNPQSPYAWSKYLFDRVVTSQNFKEITVQGFRYFNVYGEYEDHKGNQASPFYQFAKQAKETGEIILFENSENYHRDFVHVSKIIDVHKHFFNIKESGIWNIGTGQTQSFYDVAKYIANKHNAQIKFIPMPNNVKLQYQEYTCADLTKLKKYMNINGL